MRVFYLRSRLNIVVGRCCVATPVQKRPLTPCTPVGCATKITCLKLYNNIFLLLLHGMTKCVAKICTSMSINGGCRKSIN